MDDMNNTSYTEADSSPRYAVDEVINDSTSALLQNGSSHASCQLPAFHDAGKIFNDDGIYQGPHDWRRHLKPVNGCPDRPQSGRALSSARDRKLRSPDNRRLKDGNCEPSAISVCRRSSCDERGNTRLRFPVMAVRRELPSPRQRDSHCPMESQMFGNKQKRNHFRQESSFTRQVVKHQGIVKPQVVFRKPSVTCSLANDNTTPAVADIRRCIEKAQRARLYLLRQTGPNSFLIGGDSPDHKYRVIVGDQKCSCGRGSPCIHVLFVMLRVFKLHESDPLLSSKSLKNYEVESLLRSLSERRVHQKRKSYSTTPSSEKSLSAQSLTDAEPESLTDANSQTSEKGSVVESDDDDEELCPICLLEMVEGESLTICINGCQNRLHHHCISRWFEECRQEYKPLHCPLCQAAWKSDKSSEKSSSTLAPSDQRSPSPGAVAHLNDVETLTINSVPVDCRPLANEWLQVLSEEVVVRLFSRNWAVRENGLRLLSRDAVAALSGVGDDSSRVQLLLRCCFSIFAFILPDPVYKVFVAGLRALRSVLMFTPCRDVEQQAQLQTLLTPVITALLVKCADSNRRMSQLSVDTLLELIKGDAGELPVGREVPRHGHQCGLGGIDFLLQCTVEADLDSAAVQWQSLLGRLYLLDRLIHDHSANFAASTRPAQSPSAIATEPPVNYERSFVVLRFVTPLFSFPHARVAKLAHRVFYFTAFLQVRVGGMAVVEQICLLLATADAQVRHRVRQKLQLVANDCPSTLATSTEVSAGSAGSADPVVFFVSTQPSPKLEVVTDASDVTEPVSPLYPSSSVMNGDDEYRSMGSVDSGTPVVISRQVTMTDSCVQTSPVLPRHAAISPATSSPTDCCNHRPTDENSVRNEFLSRYASSVGLTEDLSELNLTSFSVCDRVSFKKEVASSPSAVFPDAENGVDEDCPCKEEVAVEEARALVAALERSAADPDDLPCVPGLSRQSDDKTVTVHVQDELAENDVHRYEEDVHWKRGVILGTGAFCTCYQAQDVRTGTLMAVKQVAFCRNSVAEQEKIVETVDREIELMSRLSHPNIVRILGATKHQCHFFVFTEWMAGCSVAYLLDKYGAFSEDVTSKYTEQVLRGVAYLHDNHVIHRDLKGANLLVDSTGHRVRIGDFGAAARLASRVTGAGEFEGQLLGTIAFMAPEVLRGASYGRSCDVWSIGCVVIEMVTTKPPWGAHDVSNHLALIYQIASTVKAPPVPENLSPPLRDLLLRCLEVNPDDRPSATELLQLPLFTMAQR